MNSRTKIAALTVVLTLVGGAAAVVVTLGMKRGTAVAAVVNGEIIYASELEGSIKAIAQQFGVDLNSKDGEKQRAEISRIVLDQLIDQRLILQEARRRNLLASDGQVDAQLADIKQNFPSERDFKDALEQRGLTVNELRNRVRASLTRQNLSANIPNATVTNAEIEKYFQEHRRELDRPEQIRVRHILLESETEARFVLAKLKRGETFQDLARQHSKDPGSKEQGGDLGLVSRGQLVGEFEQAAFALQAGQTSEIVKTQYGYHIIQVIERTSPQAASLDKAREQIRSRLLASKQEAAFQEWLKQVKAQAKIKRLAQPTK